MWSIVEPIKGSTNKVTIPTDGTITITKPDGVIISAYVNDVLTPVHDSLLVKANDVVCFEMFNNTAELEEVLLEMGGVISSIKLAGVTKNAGDTKMMTDNPINLFTNPGSSGMGGAIGGGLGAGLLGGVLGGALLGNNNGGLFGNRNGGGVSIDPWQNQANMSLMATLGDIKASVPLAQAQTAAEIMASNAATGNIVRQVNDGVMANLNMQTQMNQKGFTDNTAATVAAGNANMLATERSAYAVTQAINADGDRTRALIQSIDKTNDSRLITNLANEITELRGDRRLSEAAGNITISNNNNAVANAQQQQAQQQQQQIAYLSSQLAVLLQQNQHIQQGVLNIGSGTVSGNSQTAANTRVS